MRKGRRVWGVAAAAALAVALPLVATGTGTAQVEVTFTVVKVVTGNVPAGTTFTVQVTCLAPASAGSSSASPSTTGSTSATSSTTATTAGGAHAAAEPQDGLPPIVFNSQGQVISGQATIQADLPSTCTATETMNGGAQTSYACSVQEPATVSQVDSTSCDSNQTVDFPEDAEASATITITNAFPPAPLVVEPAFTG